MKCSRSARASNPLIRRIQQLDVNMMRVPRFEQRRRIIDPYIDADRPVIRLLPDLDGLHLIGVVGIPALIDPCLQLIRIHDQPRPIPEPDRVAVGNRQPVFSRDVLTPIGVDTADVIHHLIDEPRLIRRHDELAQERLGQPAGNTRRCARGNGIPLDSFLEVIKPLRQLCLEFRRQLRGGRDLLGLIDIEVEAPVQGPRVNAAPVGKPVPLQLLPALRFILEELVEVLRSFVLASNFLVLFAGSRRRNGRRRTARRFRLRAG